MSRHGEDPSRTPPTASEDDADLSEDEGLHHRARVQGSRPGDRYIRVVRAKDLPVRQIARGRYIARETEPTSALGKVTHKLRRTIIGRPLTSAEAEHERLSKVKALAVYSSDALSSVAYATQEIMLVLAMGGLGALNYSWPIAIGIAILLAIVILSYRQTVFAYPTGGGAYIVAKHNLGTYPSLVAAAALLIDYILTVAVSISAGVAAITSALPSLYDYRVHLAVGAIIIVLLLNLRGVTESGTIFAIPTYAFIACMFTLIGIGMAAVFGFGPDVQSIAVRGEIGTQEVSLFLILRAFAAGCTALTGVEAISDGVPAFKPPEAKNAATTLLWMGAILAAMFLGITYLANYFDLVPSHQETLISQLARTLIGEGPFYYIVQAFTALILILAANTAFADFPRLASFLARDRFLPHQFLFRGDRLAFTTGIIFLGFVSSLLVIIFDASVSNLIPLYAVGVFTSFSLSQAGMVRHWLRFAPSRQRILGLILNGGGAIATTVVLMIIITTKFLAGAWIVIMLVPFIVVLLRGIRSHYDDVYQQLRLTASDLRTRLRPRPRPVIAIVPVGALNIPTARALEYALSITNDVTAVHVAEDSAEADELQHDWAEAGMTVPLVIIESPYRALVGPLVAYVEQQKIDHRDKLINVVLPEFVPAHLGEQILHNQTALRVKAALLFRPGVVLTDVPYHLAD